MEVEEGEKEREMEEERKKERKGCSTTSRSLYRLGYFKHTCVCYEGDYFI